MFHKSAYHKPKKEETVAQLTTAYPGYAGRLVDSKRAAEKIWYVFIGTLERVSQVTIVVLATLMWLDVLTTIIVVSSGVAEQNPRAAFVIDHFGFVGLTLFQAYQVGLNLVFYFLTDYLGVVPRILARRDRRVGMLAAFLCVIARVYLVYSWFYTIAVYKFLFVPSAPNGIPQFQNMLAQLWGIPEVQLTVMRFLGP